jgi:hypothetical protein
VAAANVLLKLPKKRKARIKEIYHNNKDIEFFAVDNIMSV